MFCNKCGHQITGQEIRFCPECGNAIKEAFNPTPTSAGAFGTMLKVRHFKWLAMGILCLMIIASGTWMFRSTPESAAKEFIGSVSAGNYNDAAKQFAPNDSRLVDRAPAVMTLYTELIAMTGEKDFQYVVTPLSENAASVAAMTKNGQLTITLRMEKKEGAWKVAALTNTGSNDFLQKVGSSKKIQENVQKVLWGF